MKSQKQEKSLYKKKTTSFKKTMVYELSNFNSMQTLEITNIIIDLELIVIEEMNKQAQLYE